MLVLLVEDEPLVLEDIRSCLEEAGHDVLVASDGLQAMDCLSVNSRDIDALVTDIKLPRGPDGWRIAQRARALSSDILVLYFTGAAEHEWGMHSVPKARMLQKPFPCARVAAELAGLQGN